MITQLHAIKKQIEEIQTSHYAFDKEGRMADGYDEITRFKLMELSQQVINLIDLLKLHYVFVEEKDES